MVPVLGLNIRSEEIQTPKKRTRWKNRTSRSKILLTGLKTLQFVSFRMKDTDEMIHFYIQSRRVQGLVYVQIKRIYHKFEKYTTNFQFKNGEVGGNYQFVVLINMKGFCMFTHFYAASFSNETSNAFYLEYQTYFHEILSRL